MWIEIVSIFVLLNSTVTARYLTNNSNNINDEEMCSDQFENR